MPFLDELKVLITQRKWYDFVETLKEGLNSNLSKQDLEIACKILMENMKSLHPFSLVSVLVSLFPFLRRESSISLIEEAIEIIHKNSNFISDYQNEISCLLLYKCIASVQLDILENTEEQLISLKASKLSDENANLHCIAAAQFYEKVGNYDEAQEYLFLHAKNTKKVQDIEKLVYLSILSSRFFDFTAVATFKEFELLQNDNLKTLFLNFQNGNLNQEAVQVLTSLLGIPCKDHLQEKLHLLNIIRTCFEASEQKLVTFDHLLSKLEVSESTLLRLLLKALGLKIIRGWIDSEERILFFDSVLPRALNSEELQKMKEKFIEWKDRIQDVITAMESK
ncbi:26S proteasome regulatory subunit [Glugoides intestinalis]